MNSLTSFIHSHSFYIISLFLTCLPKKIQKLLIELFIGVRIPNIYLAFFTQSCFAVPKKKKKKKKMFIMFILCFIKKNLLKRELQQIEFNHSSDIDFEDFMNLYKKCTAKPHSFLVIDTTLVCVCVCGCACVC